MILLPTQQTVTSAARRAIMTSRQRGSRSTSCRRQARIALGSFANLSIHACKNTRLSSLALPGNWGVPSCALLGPKGRGLTRAEFDLSQPNALAPRLEQLAPAAVINCAAYTQVDRAETDSEQCFRVNALAVEALAEACNQCGAILVQISTDYVFDGSPTRTITFTEDDAPNPQGVYARSKYAGELAARKCRQHLIVRTCGLFGVGGHNFVETMLRLGAERDRLRVVDDQHCTPSYAAHVAQAIQFLLESKQTGLFHVVNRGRNNLARFLPPRSFARLACLCSSKRITTAEYRAAAPRPAFSVLDTARYDRLGGPPLAAWQEALAEYLAARSAG